MARLDETAADRLVEVFVDRYRQERAGLARPFPGIPELLADLHARGVRIGVATSKLRDDACSELAGTGLDQHVDVLVAFEDTEEHKPSPAPQLEALRRLRAHGGVAVGDLPTDVVSAQAAGLRPLAVGWGYGSDEALRAAGAEKVCQGVAELAEAIESRLR